MIAALIALCWVVPPSFAVMWWASEWRMHSADRRLNEQNEALLHKLQEELTTDRDKHNKLCEVVAEQMRTLKEVENNVGRLTERLMNG